MNKLYWLWLPIVSLITFFVLELILTGAQRSAMVAENGPIEIIQVFVLLAGVIWGLVGLKPAGAHPQKWYRAICILGGLGCIYIMGEEVSWGQHIFGWGTPEPWLAVNRQQETNLHNINSWFNQKPRLILEIGVIVGGLILPYIRRRKPGRLPDWLRDITPPTYMGVLAGCFLIVKLFDSVGGQLGYVYFTRASEIIELYLYYFIVLYLYHIVRVVKGAEDQNGKKLA